MPVWVGWMGMDNGVRQRQKIDKKRLAFASQISS